jgi:bacterioferritin
MDKDESINISVDNSIYFPGDTVLLVIQRNDNTATAGIITPILLIEGTMFFEGTPTVSKLNPIKIGKTVSEMINNDDSDELDAVRSYNEAIKLARAVDDQGTIDLLSKILKMEEGHVDWADIQRAQIEQMGMEDYLVNQVGGVAG